MQADPAGFEPATPGLEARCYILAKPRARIDKISAALGGHLSQRLLELLLQLIESALDAFFLLGHGL
jgi:hypothetical protein